jgi:hypothetical protein
MPWNLATDNNIRQLPVFEQLFAFAYAYLNAAHLLCANAIARAEDRDWAAGAVVLMNASHAVELFLKAALLKHDESIDVWRFGHDIAALATEYEKLHPQPEWAWDIPFRQWQPEGLSSEQMRIYRDGVAPPSIEFRYPVTRQGAPWLTLHGFEPHSMARDLKRIEEDFDRICNLEA